MKHLMSDGFIYHFYVCLQTPQKKDAVTNICYQSFGMYVTVFHLKYVVCLEFVNVQKLSSTRPHQPPFSQQEQCLVN